MPHQVEAETVHFVGRGSGQHRIDHQFAHHGVLGGGVRAVCAVGHAAVGVQAVVVARHYPVEHRFFALPAGVGVIVNHVDYHPQAGLVEGLHHLAELQNECRAFGVGGVAALGDGVMEWVVIPVEAVCAAAELAICPHFL